MVSAVLTQFAQNVGVRRFEVKMVETAEIEKQKCFRRPYKSFRELVTDCMDCLCGVTGWNLCVDRMNSLDLQGENLE